MINKITTGFVIQTFDENNVPVAQEFVAGDQVDWENEYGEPLDDDKLANLPYLPFEMKQPETD